jgi:hypothetical protein
MVDTLRAEDQLVELLCRVGAISRIMACQRVPVLLVSFYDKLLPHLDHAYHDR